LSLEKEVGTEDQQAGAHRDDQQPKQVADYPASVARPRGPDRSVHESRAMTIAIGHAAIVTLGPVTTEQTKSTSGADQADRAQQRADLLEQHRAARMRRDAAKLDSPDFRKAAEDIARIEVQINRLEEPDPGA